MTGIYVLLIDFIIVIGERTYEVMLSTRDGVLMHTRIVFPRNYTADSGLKFTTIIDRSPYGYTDLEFLTDLFLPYGFVTIGQDMVSIL